MIDNPRIALICPLYGKYGYGLRAALSFFKHSTQGHRDIVIFTEDAHPDFQKQDWNAFQDPLPEEQFVLHPFPTNKGLTRCWNWGLNKAAELGCEYAIAGNSDLLFTPGWDVSLTHLVDEQKFSLVGPVTNAPGPTNKGQQFVGNYFPGYQVTDDPEYLAHVAHYLRDHYPPHASQRCKINGFCTFARIDEWMSGKFDAQHVFDPSKVMTGNEDELERRWVSMGRKIGFSPASFVFHYRSVTRGERYKQKGWFRLQKLTKDV